jgi:RNA polymerase sigma-70 factor, ECF subfamily
MNSQPHPPAHPQRTLIVNPPLLQQVALGDPSAIRDCIARFGNLVWSLARRFSPADAEDAVQEIFVDLWRSAARYDPSVASETAFVAVLARRRLIDRRRRRMRRVETEPLGDVATAMSGAGSAQMEMCGEAMLAGKALAQLRPEQRTVLLLAACHGLSHEEIAQSVGLPLGTVKAHARRGLIRVREILQGAPLEGGA